MTVSLIHASPETWTIPNIICTQATHRPEAIAIEFIGSGQWTFADSKTTCADDRRLFQIKKIVQGDSVAVMIDDAELFCHCWLGLSFLGATMVAINTSMRGAPLEHQLNIAGVTTIVVDNKKYIHHNSLNHSAMLLPAETIYSTPATHLHEHEIYPASHTDTSCIMFTSGTDRPIKGRTNATRPLCVVCDWHN